MTAAQKDSFERVTAGFYRDSDPAVAAEALAHALEAGALLKDETLAVMFIHLAEVYPEVNARFRDLFSALTDPEKLRIVHVVLDPPEELKDARYLLKGISNPQDLDLCWGEFLVTGSLEVVKRIIAVLDWKDLIRSLIDEALLAPVSGGIRLLESQWQSFRELGILIGTTDAEQHPHVAVPGDVDLLIWRGLQKMHEASAALVRQLGQDQTVHLAVKGAALWSLRSNAEQHSRVKALCNAEAGVAGAAGRRYLA